MTSVPSTAVIPPGSLILITGVTGYIGAHVADQLLARGYRIRGSVRDIAKAQWLDDLFANKYGAGKYMAFHAPDLGKKHALDEAMVDVAGVVHLSSILNFSPVPYEVIPGTVAFAVNALDSAARTPSVKRFVFTSSSVAAIFPPANTKLEITKDMFNEDAVKKSKEPPPYEPSRSVWTYAASKALAEQEIWKYANEHKGKSDLVVNAVLPDFNSGAPLDVHHQGFSTSAGVVKAAFEGNIGYARVYHPQHYVDVVDDALLHVAGLLHPDVQNERIFAYAEPKNTNRLLALMRKFYPDRKFAEDDPNEGEDMTIIVQKPRAEELLRWMGRPGWRPLEDSLKELTDLML